MALGDPPICSRCGRPQCTAAMFGERLTCTCPPLQYGDGWHTTILTDYYSEKETIKRLTFLADGCKTHPSYRAKRQPTATCKVCKKLWNARKYLDELKTKGL